MAFFSRNLLLVVVVAAVVLSWIFPGAGVALKSFGLTSPLIFAIFLCQGASLDLRRFRALGTYAPLLIWGALVSFALAPLFGWLVVTMTSWTGDFAIGFLLMCCVGPTLVSGNVIAAQVGGEKECGALLVVALSLAAVIFTPIALGLTLGASVSLGAAALFWKLVTLVLLPSLIGAIAAGRFPAAIKRAAKPLKVIPVYLLGLLIYFSLAEQSDTIHAVGALQLLALVPPALAVHYVLMMLAYAGARRLPNADYGRSIALAIVCSQKTLPVAVAVWATQFAAGHPLALLPPVVFHLSQIMGDGLLAGALNKRRI